MSARRDIYAPDRRTPRAEPERPPLKIGYKLLIWCALFLLVFAAVAYLSRIEALQIKNIVIEGNSVVSSSALSDIVDQDTSGFYFFFFPKTDIFLYPKGEIEKDLRDAFPRLSSATVSRTLNGNLDVKVSEYTTSYLLCTGETFDLPCYAVDAVGHIFDTAPRYSGGVIFPFADASTTSSVATSSPIGETFLSEHELARVSDIKNATALFFQKKNIPLTVRGVVVTPDKDYDLIFSDGILKTDILFIDGTGTTTADALNLVFGTPKFQAEFLANSISKLSYVDLRFLPKVYYSFAGSTTTSAR